MKKSIQHPGGRNGSFGYRKLIDGIAQLHLNGRSMAGRAADAVMTLTYWEIGHRIVEFEQKGRHRATYGGRLLEQMSKDLRRACGRGYSVDNLELMRLFYTTYPSGPISETMSRKSPGLSPAGSEAGKSETGPYCRTSWSLSMKSEHQGGSLKNAWHLFRTKENDHEQFLSF